MADRPAGRAFQLETRYERGRLPGGRLDWSAKPEQYKDYPSAPRIALSPAQAAGGPPIWETVLRRRSVRAFAGDSVEETDLSQLLWASQGITANTHGHRFRAAPSAGALYPIETYVVVNNVRDVTQGVYHYGPVEHEMRLLRAGDFGLLVAQAALDQLMASRANIVFAWTAVFGRSTWKYRQRAYRYVYLDAGHIAQNVALAAAALGLGSCQIAAIYDDEANSLLQVDGIEESTIYMTAVGRPA